MKGCVLVLLVCLTQGSVSFVKRDLSDTIQNVPEPTQGFSGSVQNLPEDLPEDLSEDLSEDLPEDLPEDLTEDLTDDAQDLPEDLPEDVQDLPEDLPEDVQDLPEDLTDNVQDLPEDLTDDVQDPTDDVQYLPEDPTDDVQYVQEDLPEDLKGDVQKLPYLTGNAKDLSDKGHDPECEEAEESDPAATIQIQITLKDKKTADTTTTDTTPTTTTPTTTPTTTSTTTPTTTTPTTTPVTIKMLDPIVIKNAPFHVACRPNEPLAISYPIPTTEDSMVFWINKETPDFFFATKWTHGKCEEYSTYPSLFGKLDRSKKKKCPTYYQPKTNCAREQTSTQYTGFDVNKDGMEYRFKHIEPEEERKKEISKALEQLKKVQEMFSKEKWAQDPDREIDRGEVMANIQFFSKLALMNVTYDTRPYYCMSDCLNLVGTDETQCLGYTEYPEYGQARKVRLNDVREFGMQLDNLGTPCKYETPCTKNYYKDNYCNGGHACAMYGYDQYGRKCKTIHKGRRGTYCYVENPKKGEWSWGWTHPAIDTKRSTYCYIG